jgi:hypothetical protein
MTSATGQSSHPYRGCKTENPEVRPWDAFLQRKDGIMNTRPVPLATYEIRFQSLFNEGRALTFPCDAEGHVQMDELSDRARNNYLYARAVVGREFATPSVLVREVH